MADEPVDIYPKLTEDCKAKCPTTWTKYQECAKRIVNAKEGDCESWYFDHLKCIDNCRVPQLKKYLK